jgi:hypothetical protein
MKRIIIYAISLLIVVSITTLAVYNYHHNLRFICSGTLTSYENNISRKQTFSIVQELSFFLDGTAVNQVNGEVWDNKAVYDVDRSVRIEYKRISGWQYDMRITEVMKSGGDTVPETLARRQLAFLTEGTHRVVSLNLLGNDNYVFSLNRGPYFVCAKVYR